jgi:hypothetical protein
MKTSSLIVIGCVFAVGLVACQDSEKKPTQGRSRFGYQGSEDPNSTKFATPNPTPDPYATPTPPVEDVPNVTTSMPTPTPAATTATSSREMAYGTPVPGKPGFVTSPHAPYAGYVDVRGFPPGTEVKCPYSGKIFLVP